MTKTVLTLQELEKLIAKKLTEDTGRIHAPEHPIELTPAWPSYCRKGWGISFKQKEKRMQQLAYLEITETHVIDYYEGRVLIEPI